MANVTNVVSDMKEMNNAAQAAERDGGVNIQTEASAVRDWGSVCDHVMRRAASLQTETSAFLKLFQALTETYKQYRDMSGKMKGIIATQKEYVEVPDYHETYVHCHLLHSLFLFVSLVFIC